MVVASSKQVLSSSWDGRPFGHNRHGPKIGDCAPFWGSWVPIWHNVAGAEAYLHAKFQLLLDPSNRSATIHQRHRQDCQIDNGPVV